MTAPSSAAVEPVAIDTDGRVIRIGSRVRFGGGAWEAVEIGPHPHLDAFTWVTLEPLDEQARYLDRHADGAPATTPDMLTLIDGTEP